MIRFVINYIQQYDKNITKEKGKDNNIDAGDIFNENVLVPLLKLLKANDCIKLFHVI